MRIVPRGVDGPAPGPGIDKAPPLPGTLGSLENENDWGGLGGSVHGPEAAESERPVLAGSSRLLRPLLEILESHPVNPG